MQNRRNRRCRLLVFFLLPLLLLAGCETANQLENSIQQEASVNLFAMGTYIELTAYGESAETALQLAEQRVNELETLWSVTEENSDIARVNQNGEQPTQVSEETSSLLQFALDMAAQTNGAIDPTVFPVVTAWGFLSGDYRIPEEAELTELLQFTDYRQVRLESNVVSLPEGVQIDLGAFGKGYTGDLIAELMREQGIDSALLNLGGNIQMIGKKPDGSRWRLGIQNPFGEGSLGILESEDGAVVTSGNYERFFIGEDGNQYGHIIDPATGYPAKNGLVSASIIASEGKLADALSTAIYVMGLEEAVEYWKTSGAFEMILVTEEHEVYITEGIQEDFILSDDWNEGIQVIAK